MSFARLVASGCGCGYVPYAAGTFASAVAALLGALLFHIAFALVPIAALSATLAGLNPRHHTDERRQAPVRREGQ